MGRQLSTIISKSALTAGLHLFKTRRIALLPRTWATSATPSSTVGSDDSDSAINIGKYVRANHFSSSSKSVKFLLLPLLRLSNSRINNFLKCCQPPHLWVNRLTQAWEISAMLAIAG
ncbi:hypothetical protein IQ274_30365 [Nostoc sp. LEGE 12447]|uniref:hypothetical protein n=1 Tax=Nostoc sp. LEGE 12447 TaxID=1828640 RepID=UPI0018840EA2|nr:hypothetical protein [Nostoc sp. LEGE 12447]MBE9002394.1 hypothetical protein [Nostoc sp. LEGE 12447]